jgi:hypothetical protein
MISCLSCNHWFDLIRFVIYLSMNKISTFFKIYFRSSISNKNNLKMEISNIFHNISILISGSMCYAFSTRIIFVMASETKQDVIYQIIKMRDTTRKLITT